MGKNKSILLLDEILQEVFKIDGHKSKFYFYKKDTVLFKDLENQQKIFFAPMDKNIKNKKKSQGNATIAHIIDACQQEPPENTEEKKLQEIIDIFKNNHKWIWEGGKYNVDFNIFDECNIKDDAKNRSDICLKCFEKRYNKCLIRVICNFLTDYELKTQDPIIPRKIKKQVNEIYDKIQQCKETFTNEPLSYGDICADIRKIGSYLHDDSYHKLESYFEVESHIEKCLKISDYTYKNLAYIKWYIAHLKIWMGIKKREGMFLENDDKDKEQIYELLCSASTIIKGLIQNNEEITDIDFVHTESDKLMAYLICKDSGIPIEESDKPDIDYIENRAKSLKDNRLKAEIYLSLWYYSKEEKSNEATAKYAKEFEENIGPEKNRSLNLEMLNLEYQVYQYIDICKGDSQRRENKEKSERTIANLLGKILQLNVAKSNHKDTFVAISRLYYSSKGESTPIEYCGLSVITAKDGEEVKEEEITLVERQFQSMGSPDEYRLIMGIEGFFSIHQSIQYSVFSIASHYSHYIPNDKDISSNILRMIFDPPR